MNYSCILVNAINNPDINFSIPATRKYYHVDSGFAHRLGYMAHIKVPIFDTIFRSFVRCRQENVNDIMMHANDSISITCHVGMSLRGRLSIETAMKNS